MALYRYRGRCEPAAGPVARSSASCAQVGQPACCDSAEGQHSATSSDRAAVRVVAPHSRVCCDWVAARCSEADFDSAAAVRRSVLSHAVAAAPAAGPLLLAGVVPFARMDRPADHPAHRVGASTERGPTARHQDSVSRTGSRARASACPAPSAPSPARVDTARAARGASTVTARRACSRRSADRRADAAAECEGPSHAERARFDHARGRAGPVERAASARHPA